jgi:multidrug efflux pump subunit AcrB
MEETFIELGTALLFAIFLVYVVMAVQFESIFYPLVVMFSMPTMVIGVLIGLFITNTPISMMVLIGLIMLAGIVVNNAIVLIDYVNLMRRRGMERFEAIVEAGPARLRAILMTTLTTLLAMVPMALGLGEGSEQQVPLAITIIFGLTTSSVFTLLFVPVMYTILDDISSWIKRKVFRRSVPAPASETGADA